MVNWDAIPDKVFVREEFDDPKYPGSGDLIDSHLIHKLVGLRLYTKWPMIIHGKVGGAVDVDGSWGHAPHSYHRKDMGCKAVDFHFITDASPREQAYYVSLFAFGGIGFYFDWHWNGKLLPIGFHVDTRPIKRFQMWKRERGKYIYMLK